MIGFGAIDRDHLRGHGTLGREAEEGIRAIQSFRQRSRLCLGRISRLPLVHAFLAALVDDALRVAENDVLARHAERAQELEAGDASGACAVDDKLEVLDRAARQLERVQEASGGDDGRAMLVIVEYRDIEQFLQLLFDDEAVGSLDVFEVDAAE